MTNLYNNMDLNIFKDRAKKGGIFSKWVLESSAFTRLRRNAALGLAPPIPAAGINSRSTATPFEQSKLLKRNKKKK